MKERPILFSGPMVRAILEGRKTQTRRISGLSKINENPDQWDFRALTLNESQGCVYISFRNKHTGLYFAVKYPYGQGGDRLWVRETHCVANGVKPLSQVVLYKADNQCEVARWKPSIHMPRWASRITLEITDIRVERLQDISQEDAKAEGIVFVDHGKDKWGQQVPGWNIKEKAMIGPEHCFYTPRFAFVDLWLSVNGPGSWNKNPWVWVIEFRRVS